MNMKNLLFSVLALLFFGVSSCKKEDPKPATGASSATPVFSFTGNIDGTPISLQAGGNNYFMYTSYSLDSNGVYDFIGELKPQNCTGGCGNSLKISIKDYQQFSVSPTTIDSAIVPGYYAFAAPSGASSQYSNIFISVFKNGTAQSFNWDFGDGTKAVLTSSTAVHKYLHPGVYKVSLTTESTTGCSSTITNNIQFGQTGNSFLPQFQVTIVGDTVFLSPIPIGGIPPYTYSWDFGDGNTSTSISPSHKYSASGVYQASLTMTDVMGVSGIQYMNIPINSNTNCSSSFILPSPTPLVNPMNLGNVAIEWTDAAGTLWTSKSNNQPSSRSMFKIISVEDYLNNPNGVATKKIHVKFSCTLYNGYRFIIMNDVDAVFSVGYK